MMTVIFELLPPESAGGVRIGASRDEAHAALSRRGDVESFTKGGTSPTLSVQVKDVDMSIFAYLDGADRVKAVELGKPSPDAQVLFQHVDVFATPANELISWLGERTRVTEHEHGSSYRARDLLLAFWRSGSPEDPEEDDWLYFESVLVASPVHYEKWVTEDSAIILCGNSRLSA